jgi:CelD/BcsL family acetyltransferase involved in cellulose biosynthesis
MKAEIIAAIDEESIPQSDWDSLIACGNTNTPFQHRDWLLIWLRTVGAKTEPFFIKLTDEERVVGLVPLVIAQSTLGPLNIRVLQFVGQPQADYGDFLLAENKAACLREMLSCILAHADLWDVATFEHICETSPNFPLFGDVLRQAEVPHQIISQEVLPYVEIGAAFNEYWGGRSRHLRQDVAKKERRLALLGNTTFKKYRGSEGLSFLEPFFLLLKIRDDYKDRLESGQAYERDRNFLAALLREEKLTPFIHFSSLDVDNLPIAFHFGFVDHQTVYYYKSAYSPEYAEYSPSKLLIKQLVLDCERCRYGTLDFLLGNEAYKYQWSTGEKTCYKINVFNDGWKSRLACWWLAGVRPCLKRSSLLVKAVKIGREIRRKVLGRQDG